MLKLNSLGILDLRKYVLINKCLLYVSKKWAKEASAVFNFDSFRFILRIEKEREIILMIHGNKDIRLFAKDNDDALKWYSLIAFH